MNDAKSLLVAYGWQITRQADSWRSLYVYARRGEQRIKVRVSDHPRHKNSQATISLTATEHSRDDLIRAIK